MKGAFMTNTRPIEQGVALNAALAIIKETAAPLKHREGGGNVTADYLAGIIARETRMSVLLAAIEDAIEQIEYCKGDMRTGNGVTQLSDGGSARVYDKLRRARTLLRGLGA
jgi:hypothetical protein